MNELYEEPIDTRRYICRFCNEERRYYNRTEICYHRKWYLGCHDCFMRSIDAKTRRKFQLTKYDLKGGERYE